MAKVKQTEQVEERVVKPVTARNDKQKEFLKNLATKDINIFVAPAGVGKSFLSVSQALLWLDRGVVDKITITRPNVVMGRSLGSLKGELSQKFEPLILPMLEVMKFYKGADWVTAALENELVSMAPLEYLRGRSFSDVLILDEAQLTTPDEMYTICTRMADGGKAIILGDPTQKEKAGTDGISWLLDFTKRHGMEDRVGYVEATSDDIERGGFCKAMVKGREKDVADNYMYKGD